MIAPAFQSSFDKWLDEALSLPIPSGVIAFAFNLAEPWCIEIVGTDTYSEEDDDWACDEAFRPTVNAFALPESEVGSNWETVLEAAKKMVSQYIDRPSVGSEILKKAAAVTVGFVDGNLSKIWPR